MHWTSKKFAVTEAIAQATKHQRSIAVRCGQRSGRTLYYAQPTTEAIREGDREIATVHCDGRVEVTSAPASTHR